MYHHKHHRGFQHFGTNMNLTLQEKSLMQKVPEQWRSLLTLLLGNNNKKGVKRERLMTLVTMRYRRQMTHSTESWEALLTAMSRRIPVVGSDGCLCFQSLLWSFPDSFIQDFLKFLLRFHDTISGDSLDRFLKMPAPDSCVSFTAPLFQELSTILEKRSGTSLGAETVREKTSVHEALAANGVERDCSRSDFVMSHGGIIVGDAVSAESDAGNSRCAVQLSGISRVNHPDKETSEGVQSDNPSVLNTEMFGANKPTTSPASSKTLTPRTDPVLNYINPQNNTEELRSTEAELPTADTVNNLNSIILILDNSDEDDVHEKGEMEEKEDMEVDNEKGAETADEVRQDAETEMAAECGKEEPGICKEMNVDVNREIAKRHGDHSAMSTMSKEDQQGESVMAAEEETSVQKLKEALWSGGRDAVSSDFHFLSSLPASQVGQCFAAVEWSGIEEEAVCGLIQSMVGLSEKLSHAVTAVLVQSIVKPIYQAVEETPSRQLMSSLSDLAAACPQQLASALCDCLQESLCSSVQSEMVTCLCKNWTTATLLFFLRKLCRSDPLLDDNLLAVVQCVLGKQPDLGSDLLESVLRLLETGSAPLARNAKYGRLVLNFVKNYKTQINASHLPSLQSIVSVHSSVIRKSLQSAVNSLPSSQSS